MKQNRMTFPLLNGARPTLLAITISQTIGSSLALAADPAPATGNDGQACQQQCTDRPSGTIRDDSAVYRTTTAVNQEFEHIATHWQIHGLPPLPGVDIQLPKTTYTQEQMTLSDLRFRSGYHALSEQVIQQLEHVIGTLKGSKINHLHVTGHTDNQPLSRNARQRYADNQALSVARAAEVARYLQTQLGLREDQVSIQGKGASAPIADNTSPEGRSKNRRVDIDVQLEKPHTEMTVIHQTPSRAYLCQTNPATGPSVPFSITIDGKGPHTGQADEQRCTDVALAGAEIQLTHDALHQTPRLNAGVRVTRLPDSDANGKRSWKLAFYHYSNYEHFITRREIRIFERQASPSSTPLAIVPVDQPYIYQSAHGKTPDLVYRLRVYDKAGHFDETETLPIHWPDKPSESQAAAHDPAEFPLELRQIWGESHLAIHTIPVEGSELTVHGRHIPEGHAVYFLGQRLPVNAQNEFVAQQILPAGDHQVEIAVLDANQQGKIFQRKVRLTQDDWFYVAMADITIGKNRLNGLAKLLTSETGLDDDLFVDGRFAFYLKGTWRQRYRITASADTREAPLEDLFSNLDEKNPDSLLRRLEEDKIYSVYGDDSTLTEDAPTQGKFYFRVEDDYSRLEWGNFQSDLNQTDLTRLNRGLYGAHLDWNSAAFTPWGEHRTRLDLFASDPGTVPAVEELRGTGGSLYYLQHQAITSGSEIVTVEVRDKDSGLTISTRRLTPGNDYTVDTLQGRILLTRPLASFSDDGWLIREEALGGNPQYLVVNYEYTPAGGALDDFLVGGRLSHWFDDHWQAGVTASHQNRTARDDQLTGADVTYRLSADSYIKAEVAESKGQGTDPRTSADGGYLFTNQTLATGDDAAQAFRLESKLHFRDFTGEDEGEALPDSGWQASIAQFYVQHNDAGYAGQGQRTPQDTDRMGIQVSYPASDETTVTLKADHLDQTTQEQQTAEANVQHQLDDHWSLQAGTRFTRKDSQTKANETGKQLDLAAKLAYDSQQDWQLYGFVQGSAQDDTRDENHRGGLGGRYALTEKLALKGEVSDGNRGFGAQIGTDYQFSDSTNLYLNYHLDPDQSSQGVQGNNGQVVAGGKTRYSDHTSVYAEERYQHGTTEGLTHAWGVEYAPVDRWVFGVHYEQGEIRTGDNELQRQAAGLNANYSGSKTRYGGALEYRQDDDSNGPRDSWLMRNNLSYRIDPDWRVQLRADLATSDANGDLADTYYREFLLGFAWRPVTNDKLNALFTYNYLADLAPLDQQDETGNANTVAQRSHVLAVDANYDLTPRWTLGGKYARRLGEIREARDSGEWYDSTAQLYVARLDWHVVRHWDVTAEARLLTIDPAKDERKGGLLAVHRHFGEHFKAGIGYNFTDFSDDLTNLNYDAKGWFLNLVGKL